MMACCVNPVRGASKIGSIGMPLPDVEIRIVDAEDGRRELATGEVGELLVRAPQIMLEYWNNPLETSEVLRTYDAGAPWLPSVDVNETDTELAVSMEVPGLDREDLDLTITPQGLIVRGEERDEREERRRDTYVTERRYGSFVRTVPLPPGLDVDRAEARVERGVLTVRFPKSVARTGGRRIPIKS